MTWYLTPCTYSPEQGADCSPTSYSDIDLLAQSKSSHTPEKFCLQGSLTEAYLDSLFGMMSPPFPSTIQIPQPLLSDSGKEDRNSPFAAGSRNCARTSAQQERGLVLVESEADSGPKWHGSFARYDQDSSSWKTAQCSLVEGLDEFSETWPKWGSMRNGVAYQRPTPEHLTSEKESGLWQTPVADDAVDRKKGKWNSRGEPKLSAQVILWPTPTVCGNYNRKGLSPTSGDGLATAVRNIEPGLLNPDWVEWLMGWPIGMTALKPLATARLQEWQQQHSLNCSSDLTDKDAA